MHSCSSKDGAIIVMNSNKVTFKTETKVNTLSFKTISVNKKNAQKE